MTNILTYQQINASNIHEVGGKNASLAEMTQNLTSQGLKVPGGFVTTTYAYKKFLEKNGLNGNIHEMLNRVNINNVEQLKKVSQQIKNKILKGSFDPSFEREIADAYRHFKNMAMAVRSSATTEDSAEASFAGQQETYLNVKGVDNILAAIKNVYASLFNKRAIAYRVHQGFDHNKVAISVGIQPMVRSDKAVSGVMFTLDTESGFDQVICINASYGLGETIVQGQVNPDEFYIHKPMLAAGKHAILRKHLGEKSIKMIYAQDKNAKKTIATIKVPEGQRNIFCLTEAEIHDLARQGLLIEKHYGKPMDIEWAKDGLSGELYIVQARPETVKSREKRNSTLDRYQLTKKGKIITTGSSVGQRIGQGKARIITNPKQMVTMQDNEVLVTDMTDPDWEPIMKRAAAIVTNRGGRTCHAAIVARELGIPAVVGCGNATHKIKNGQTITVSCAEGQIGNIYNGILPYTVEKIPVKNMPELPIDICINMGNPEKAFNYQFLPNKGVGLARLEFIISNTIGIHPNAALNFKQLPTNLRAQIQKKISGYQDGVDFYVKKLTEGIATIAAAFYPKNVIFRFSDFKTNEYANLLGGELFEPHEENPMLGFRGASRYISQNFKNCFELECKAFKNVRETMGLTNAHVMVPFVRTLGEIEQTLALMTQFNLARGKNGLKVYMMCEIPSNVILAEEFLKYVDGFSIGSNDLTQLVLGLDRDSNLVANIFDERNAAVKAMLHQVINACNKAGKYIGICGQGPSDHPDFAKWLTSEGIQNMSLNPDTVVETWLMLAGKKDERKQ